MVVARVTVEDGETSYDAGKTSLEGAVDGITRAERRRRWHPQQKLAIVQESLAHGSGPSAVARRYGISTGLLYTWRKQLLAAATEGFVPCEIVDGPLVVATPMLPRPDDPVGPVTNPVAASGAIDIELPGGAKVRIGGTADPATLRLVLDALAR